MVIIQWLSFLSLGLLVTSWKIEFLICIFHHVFPNSLWCYLGICVHSWFALQYSLHDRRVPSFQSTAVLLLYVSWMAGPCGQYLSHSYDILCRSVYCPSKRYRRGSNQRHHGGNNQCWIFYQSSLDRVFGCWSLALSLSQGLVHENLWRSENKVVHSNMLVVWSRLFNFNVYQLLSSVFWLRNDDVDVECETPRVSEDGHRRIGDCNYNSYSGTHLQYSCFKVSIVSNEIKTDF